MNQTGKHNAQKNQKNDFFYKVTMRNKCLVNQQRFNQY